MNAVLLIGAVMLALSAVLLLVRITVGPSMLDRTIGLDVLVSVVICALALEAAHDRHLFTLPVLVALSLLGFVGSVGVAAFTKGSDHVEDDRSRADSRPHEGRGDR